MKKILVSLSACWLLYGCGNKISDAPDNTGALLVGTWDSVSNNETACQERIRLNSDKTFWWFKDNEISSGTYGVDNKQLNFKFTNKSWEMVKFKVSDRDLYIERMGNTKTYTRVPSSVSKNTSSLCPATNKGDK